LEEDLGIVASIDNGKDFEAITEMIQPGILADIVDKGEVPNKFKPGTTQHKCMFVWILAEEDSEGVNKRVFQTFTVSLHEKASLRKFIKGLFGKDIESPTFDLDTLLGTQRLLVLTAEDSKEPGGKPFVKVTAAMALKKGMTAPAIPSGFIRKQDQVAK
jgi:hypothetical protein